MRILFAGVKSGSGKTLLTCAFLQYLKNAGYRPCACKTGPDYIDPMFHREVLDVPGGNLDTFFTEEEMTLALLRSQMKKGDLLVIEGVMGLFDGMEGIGGRGSTYDLARVTKTPVVLVVDAKGMGQSLVPLIRGYLHYDTTHLIKGVILNRAGKAWGERLRPLLEEETGIRLIGTFPDDAAFRLESRPLGLIPPKELPEIRSLIAGATEQMEVSLDMDALLEIAKSAEEIPEPETASSVLLPETDVNARTVIAVARDEAFCFLYEENLMLLESLGAELSYFSPLHDAGLPKGAKGMLLPGGYPERYAKALSANVSMLEDIRDAVKRGMPLLAEGGGFLYLHEEVETPEGDRFSFVGTQLGVCRNAGHLVRFGYKEVTGRGDRRLAKNETLRGHEFHYYDADGKSRSDLAKGWVHWYYPSCPEFAKRFVEAAREYNA